MVNLRSKELVRGTREGFRSIDPASFTFFILVIIWLILYYGGVKLFQSGTNYKRKDEKDVLMNILFGVMFVILGDFFLTQFSLLGYYSTKMIKPSKNFWEDIVEARLAFHPDIGFKEMNINFNFRSEVEHQFVKKVFNFPIPWRIAHLISATTDIKVVWREFMITYFDSTLIKTYGLLIFGYLVTIASGEIKEKTAEEVALLMLAIISIIILIFDYLFLVYNVSNIISRMNEFNKIKKGMTLSSTFQNSGLIKVDQFKIEEIEKGPNFKKINEPRYCKLTENYAIFSYYQRKTSYQNGEIRLLKWDLGEEKSGTIEIDLEEEIQHLRKIAWVFNFDPKNENHTNSAIIEGDLVEVIPLENGREVVIPERNDRCNISLFIAKFPKSEQELKSIENEIVDQKSHILSSIIDHLSSIYNEENEEKSFDHFDLLRKYQENERNFNEAMCVGQSMSDNVTCEEQLENIQKFKDCKELFESLEKTMNLVSSNGNADESKEDELKSKNLFFHFI